MCHVNPAAPRPASRPWWPPWELSRRQRIEVIDRGRKAKAAKAARIRRLTRAVTAEVRQLLAAREGGRAIPTRYGGWSVQRPGRKSAADSAGPHS